ncbi:MAG: chemotaxis protein CheX [Zetaproteobacteria bacterium]|nr:chemotaxis protein CheX [Zetaproteobacteria bacterium]
MKNKHPDEWLKMLQTAFQEVLNEFARGVTNLDYQLEACDDESLHRHIAMVEMFADDFQMHVGLATEMSGATFLSQLLLGDEDLLDEYLRADALGEMINIITGRIKRNLLDEGAGSDLGIPIVIEGRLIPISRHECHISTMILCNQKVQLFVLVKPYS